MSKVETNKGSLVAERTLKALMLFSRSKSIFISEVAQSLEISITAAYRIIDTLNSMGFIKRNDDKSYSLDPLNIMQLYNMIEHDLRNAARPILKNLVDQLEESVYVSVLYKEKFFMYIEKEDSSSPFTWSTNLGEVLPLPAGTAGKTHLAYMLKDLDESEKDAIISGLELKSFTRNSITNAEDLKKSLNKILEDGYCFTNSEYINGVIGFTVPIFNFNHSKVVAVLGINIIESNYSEDKSKKIVTLLKEGAEDISKHIY